MERYIDQFDVVNELNARTGFYKKDIRVVLEELENIILENMQMATVDEPSQCRLFFGFVIGAKRIPSQQRAHPKTKEMIEVAEHLNPYVKFKSTFQKKANNFEEGDEDFDEEYME